MSDDLIKRDDNKYVVIMDYSDNTVSYAKLEEVSECRSPREILGKYGKDTDACSWFFTRKIPSMLSLDELYAWRKIRSHDDAVKKAKETLTDMEISRMSPYGIARYAIDGDAKTQFTGGNWYTPSLRICEDFIDDGEGEYLGAMEMCSMRLLVYGNLMEFRSVPMLNHSISCITWEPGNWWNRWAVTSQAKARHLSRWFYMEILDEMFPSVEKVWLGK